MHPAKTLFTQDQKKAIDEAVSKAEKATAGEIVPVLASRAGAYTHGLYHSAVSFAIMATLGLVGGHLVLAEQLGRDVLDIPVYVLLPVQLVALLLGYHLARFFPGMHRAFLPKAVLQHRVEHAARRAFRDLGVAKTAGSTGIMLYVSLFERVALVLADKGIAAKCPQATWDGVRDLLIGGLRKDEPMQGYVQAIEECGKILAKEFPAGAENPNELPNQLRVV